MTLDEAIRALRQHNVTGASVLRITKGKALEKDLLAQVLNSCEQLISEKAEYKRLLKAAVEDMSEKNFCVKVCKRDNFACRVSDTCDFKWRYADEAEKLLNDEKITNVK